MVKRWVSWAAVSSLPQAKKISLSDQRANNLAAIEKYGGTLVEHLEVPGKSRNIVLFEDAAAAIPAYARLYELIKAKAFDVLVYLDRSRLGRTAALSMTVVELCQRAGIVCYELENPPASIEMPEERSYDDMLLGAIKSTGYQREIQKIQQKHRMGMLERTRKGKFSGRVPWGWTLHWHADGLTYDILIDEAAADAIQRALNLVRMGMGFGLVADEMNRLGYVNQFGRPFTYSVIDNIVWLRWRYAGYAEINRISAKRPYVRAKGEFPPLIDEALAQAIDEELERREGSRTPRAALSLFSGVCRCAECGETMHYTRTRRAGADGVTRLYTHIRCTNRHPGRHISEASLLADVRLFFQGMGRMAGDVGEDTQADMGAQALAEKEAWTVAEIERLTASMAQLDRRYYVLGKITADSYEALTLEIQERLTRLQSELALLRDDVAKLADAGRIAEKAETVRANGLAWLDSTDVQAANHFLRSNLQIHIRAGQVEKIVII